MRRFFHWLILGSALVQAAASAHAAVWLDPSTDEKWNNAANWSTGTVPVAADQVDIPSGNVVYSTGDFPRSAPTNLSGSATLTITSGRFQNAADTSSEFTISDNAKLNHTGQYFICGFYYGGTITQTGGSITSNVTRGFLVSDRATNPANSTTYNLQGGNLNVILSPGSNPLGVQLGKAGDNDLFLVNGGSATFTNNNSTFLVHMLRNSTFQIKSGSATFNSFQYLYVGDDFASATPYTAKFLIEGGETVINNQSSDASAFVIGGGRDGRFEMSGGKLTVTGGAMWIGDRAGGTAVQTGGDILLMGIDLVLANQAASQLGHYEMSGGTLSARDIRLGSGTGTKEFIFTGGKITLSGNKCGIIDQGWFNHTDTTGAFYDVSFDETTIQTANGVWNGGSTVDGKWKTAKNWNPESVPAPRATLLFDGSIRTNTVNDFDPGTAFGGIRFLKDAASFTLNGNDIVLASDIVNLGSNSQTINLDMSLSGDRIVNTGTADMTISKAIHGAFALTKSGTGTLTLTTDSDYTGNTTVLEGAMIVGNLTQSLSVSVLGSSKLTAKSIVADSLTIGTPVVQPTPVPEPTAGILLTFASLGFWFIRGRK